MLSPSRVISEKLQQRADRYEANRAMGQRSMAKGIVGQDVIMWRLRSIGVLMVERVHTPWRIERSRGRNGQPSRITAAYPLQKVSGDFRGILPGGRSVMCEVKRVDVLRFSEFDKHQVEALNDHAQLGGLSLIGWCFPGGDAVLAWPVPGFNPRTSLSVETARALNITRIRQ